MNEPNIPKKNAKPKKRSTLLKQLLPLTPILTLIIGFFLNSGYEQFKAMQTSDAQDRARKREFIDRQLSEFYYPILHHLQKDDAVWSMWNDNQFSDKNGRLAKYIEQEVLLPNHESISKLLETKFNLVRNSSENIDINSLNNQLLQYQRHIAVYRALRKTNDKRNTTGLPGCNCSFPNQLEKEINKRIASLESQRKSL
ncbi:hypothetical protein [Larkinella rosea]|uniref:Uncharacterized protein n=1 Tax=Larkinella rosea TaxID=2025312 RepID=A0A3P1C0A8_9BACT|nr:hypothetical protein [Larkinella rosea]RRB06841.1 hypothetical protein EHT25_03370 [Larkinella rosea]